MDAFVVVVVNRPHTRVCHGATQDRVHPAWPHEGGGSRAVTQPAKAQPHHQAGARKATPSASRRLTRLVCEALVVPDSTLSPRLRRRRRRRDARGAPALGEPQRRTARREPRPCTVTMCCASRRAIACPNLEQRMTANSSETYPGTPGGSQDGPSGVRRGLGRPEGPEDGPRGVRGARDPTVVH